jgi:hypothetical protein
LHNYFYFYFFSQYENNSQMMATFNYFLSPEMLLPLWGQRQERNQNDPQSPFGTGRRTGCPRLNALPQPRAINHQPAFSRKHVNRGARNADRGRGQAGAPLAEPKLDLDPGIEVDNLRILNENRMETGRT